MEPRFTRGEYWLLETVVVGGRPLLYLPATGIEATFNKPGHGMDRESLVETLERLFRTGLIGAAKLSAGGCAGPFNLRLDRDEIEAAIDETRDGYRDLDPAYDETYYGLTPEGGRQWEAFAAPDWDRYVEYYTRPSHSERWNIGVLISPRRDLVERVLEGARHLGHAVDHKHLHRKQIRPWQATYWKQLPQGYLVSYRYDEVEHHWEDNPHGFMELIDNRRWCRWI